MWLACPQDQYIEMTSHIVGDANLYGYGERTSSRGLALQRNAVPLTLWNRDQGSRNADQNLYGSHPFVMELRPGALPGCGGMHWPAQSQHMCCTIAL